MAPVIMLGGGLVAPDSIASLTGWWKAESLGLADGTEIDEWDDEQGPYTFLDGGATAKPLYKTSIINGRPVVRFDGVNDYMFGDIGDHTLDTLINNDAGTIMSAQNVTNIGTDSATAVNNEATWASGTTGDYVGTYLRSSGTVFGSNYDTNGDHAAHLVDAEGAWSCITWMHGGGNVYSGIDDTRTASLTSLASGNTHATPMAGILRLGRPFSNAFYLEYDLAEICFFDTALSEADRQTVERWFANRYSITLPY